MLQTEPAPLDGIPRRTRCGQVAQGDTRGRTPPCGHRVGGVAADMIPEAPDGALGIRHQEMLQDSQESLVTPARADPIPPASRAAMQRPAPGARARRAGRGPAPLRAHPRPHRPQQREPRQPRCSRLQEGCVGARRPHGFGHAPWLMGFLGGNFGGPSQPGPPPSPAHLVPGGPQRPPTKPHAPCGPPGHSPHRHRPAGGPRAFRSGLMWPQQPQGLPGPRPSLRWAPAAWRIGQAGRPMGREPATPQANRGTAPANEGRQLRHRVALGREQGELGPWADPAERLPGQAVELAEFFRRWLSGIDPHAPPPACDHGESARNFPLLT
jgi:hypothetical protein